ncbi:MAG: hypothetical protein PHN18_10780 [Sulfurospirillaceae bacterium]|nr:hypothetical protein [Sulfurospirillaceae bacterium]MDD2827374.1 hypothetical protein [Sulfurospirillaceae bacterium]
MEDIIEVPEYNTKEKIFKAKDIIINLEYYGASFDKLKTNTPNRARAIVLGYKVWKSGLNEEQLRLVINRKIDDREIVDVLEYKEKKSIRSWAISSKIKEDDYKVKLARLWCKKLGALCLLGNIGQKEIIEFAKDRFKNELNCTIPKEF